MHSLLLWLRLSIAIYWPLIKLTHGVLPNACYASSIDETIISCSRINVNEVVPLLQPNVTILKMELSEQNVLDIPFKLYIPSIVSLMLLDGQLGRLENGSLSGLSDLEYLELSNNKLSYISEDSFLECISLQTFDLRGNRFVSLNDVIPALLYIRKPISLDLSQNLFESISFKNVDLLRNLSVEKLNLGECLISNADPLVIANWNIQQLRISSNPIDDKCLKNISLGLQYSSVRSLEALSLSYLAFNFDESPLLPMYDSGIRALKIGRNDFTFTLTFRSFLSLRELQIVSSKIYELDMDSVLGLPRLENLKLSENIIRNFNNSIKVISNVKKLHLNNNQFLVLDYPVIPKGLFLSVSNLLEFNAERTLFGNIVTTKLFADFQNLKELRLFGSSIEEIEDSAFQNMTSLTMLSLSNNKLRLLRSEMFFGLRNLIWLFLDNNLISFINDSTPFSHLINLEILILRHNMIVYLKPSYFVNLTNLSAIDLNDNIIVPWNVSVIPEDGKVKFMYLRSNKLNAVTPAMMKDFDNLKSIDLAENNFDCSDCNMPKFQEWILSTTVTLEGFKNRPEIYSCHSPLTLKDTHIMEVNIEHCAPEEDWIITLLVAMSCSFVVMLLIGTLSFKLRWYFRYCCYLLRSRVKRFKDVQDPLRYEYDAFVSYDSTDNDWITTHLLATLENSSSNIKFFLLERDCVAGNDVTEEIFEVVQKCRKTLLVLSESYVKNQWCMFEMHMAQHSLFEEKRDSLILIQLQPIREDVLTANLEYLITTRTYIMWTDHPVGQKLFWRRLLAALAKPDVLQMSRIV